MPEAVAEGSEPRSSPDGESAGFRVSAEPTAVRRRLTCMRWIADGVEYLVDEPLEPWEIALLDRVRAGVQSDRAT